jgi:hypothetical protein
MKNIILVGIYTQKQRIMGANLAPEDSVNCDNKKETNAN